MKADLPLAGWQILVTRPTMQAQALIDALLNAGAVPVPYPTISVEPPPSWTPFDAALGKLADYDWFIFTSPSAVRCALEHAPHLAALLNSASSPKVAAVGSETAGALTGRGIPVALVPADQRQEGLVDALRAMAPGTKVLFPQAVGGRGLLAHQLAAAGAILNVVPVSQTVSLPLTAPPPSFDAAIFASPSALRALLSRWTANILRGKTVAVMGPTTQTAAQSLGIAADVVAPMPSVAALVEALSAYRRHLGKD